MRIISPSRSSYFRRYLILAHPILRLSDYMTEGHSNKRSPQWLGSSNLPFLSPFPSSTGPEPMAFPSPVLPVGEEQLHELRKWTWHIEVLRRLEEHPGFGATTYGARR